MADRFVLLGLAHARSPWFRDVGRWANAAAIPAEFVKCLTVEEVRARLAAGRPYSALLIDGSLPGADRDLLDAVTETGAAVFVIDDRRLKRDRLSLGASRILEADFTRSDLLDALENGARPISRADTLTLGPSTDDTVEPSWSGRLIAVTGSGGTGASVVSMALAQALATDPRFRQLVLLADLALDGEQAVLHDARDVVPGLQEVVEAFRTGAPTSAEIRTMVFSTDGATITSCWGSDATATGPDSDRAPSTPLWPACCTHTGWWWPMSMPTSRVSRDGCGGDRRSKPAGTHRCAPSLAHCRRRQSRSEGTALPRPRRVGSARLRCRRRNDPARHQSGTARRAPAGRGHLELRRAARRRSPWACEPGLRLRETPRRRCHP